MLTLKLKDLFGQRGNVKIAISITELVQKTNDHSVSKAPNCSAQFYHGDMKRLLLVYRVRCGEKSSNPSGHKVRVLFDTSAVGADSGVENLDVKVSCGCEAFLYWGAQWNLGQEGALEGKPRPLYQAPTKDNRKNFLICKHIKVVADRIGPYLQRLLDKFNADKVEEQKKQEEIREEHAPAEKKPENVKRSPSKKSPTPAPKSPVKQPVKPVDVEKEEEAVVERTEKSPAKEETTKQVKKNPVRQYKTKKPKDTDISQPTPGKTKGVIN